MVARVFVLAVGLFAATAAPSQSQSPPPPPPPPPTLAPRLAGASGPTGPSGVYDFFPPTRVGYFEQTVDHFSFDSAATFPQKFLVYDKFWRNNGTARRSGSGGSDNGGATGNGTRNGTSSDRGGGGSGGGGPIFFFFGGEGGVEDFYNNSGALFEYAPEFGGLIVFLEHRYYGTSVPPAPAQAPRHSSANGSHSTVVDHLRYLTIEQALADTAEFLASKAAVLGCAVDTPVVLWGGSYGGMLAAWHRFKFPHLSAGAVASSAPITLTGPPQAADMQQVFLNATLQAYGKYGGDPACASRLAQGIADVAQTTDWGELSQTFRTCRPVAAAADVNRLVFYIKGAFATLTMLDYPYANTFVTNMPADPVGVACAILNGTATLPGRAGPSLTPGGRLNDAMNVFVNYTGQLACHNISMEMVGAASTPAGASRALLRHHRHGAGKEQQAVAGGSSGQRQEQQRQQAEEAGRANPAPPQLGSIYDTWNYQACTELILEPLTSDGNGFYVESDAQVPEVEATCARRYPGVVTRATWVPRAFGTGADVVRHSTNIVFSDGDKDPWSVGSIPYDAVSPDGSVFHVLAEGAAHHQDLRFSDPRDSASLTQARGVELREIRKWLGQ